MSGMWMVGGFTMDSLTAEQSGDVEAALWSALRALKEAAALRRRLMDRAKVGKLMGFLEGLEKDARHLEEQAGPIEKILLDRGEQPGRKPRSESLRG